MALYVKLTAEKSDHASQHMEWHIGESFPYEELGRVVSFQADGDELRLFLDAMVASAGEHPHVDYRKMEGFTAKTPETPRKKQYRIMYTPNISASESATGIVRMTRGEASRWIEANPARGGTWSIREENA
jgi:hypothetical protein